MSTNFKFQEHFAHDLAQLWLCKSNRPQVRETIRKLKNKQQAAYIAARIMAQLITRDDFNESKTTLAQDFLDFMHPNRKD